MSDAGESPDEYHLVLDADEVPVAASAVRLLISDEAHEPEIRGLARDVLALLGAPADERGVVTVPLSPRQMKITHSAVRLLINDLQREQHVEREILWRIIQKLPDEHVMRAIEL
ncbi:MAG TPA: hypothetical protein VF927_08110 [Solirubrobacteraceae bacterium]